MHRFLPGQQQRHEPGPSAGFVLYGVSERRGAVVQLRQFVGDRVLGSEGLKQPLCDFPAGILAAVHFPDSGDRTLWPFVGNSAMFVVLPVGRCSCRIAQLIVVVLHEKSP